MRLIPAALLCGLGTAAQAQYSVAQVEFDSANLDLVSAQTLHLSLTVADSEALAKRYVDSTVKVVNVDANSIDIVVSRDARFTSEPLAKHLAASFVVDYDEPALESLNAAAAALAPSDQMPSADALATLVFEAIPDKTQERGFDIASQAARAGAGDCTEHAVLLAAVARARGLPARVVLGSVILVSEEASGAFGHAWTEVYVDGEWQLVDATQPEGEGANAFYVPISTLGNEGPGYGMALIDGIRTMPSHVAATAVGKP